MYQPDQVFPNPELRSMSMAIYIVAAFTAVCQYFESTILLGLLLLVIAYFMKRGLKFTTKGTAYDSHADWIGNTLYIGTFFLFPIALTIAMYMIWKYTSVSQLWGALQSDDPDALMLGVQAHLVGNIEKIKSTTQNAMILPILWWLRRCWFGFMRAKRGEPIDYPDGWL